MSLAYKYFPVALWNFQLAGEHVFKTPKISPKISKIRHMSIHSGFKCQMCISYHDYLLIMHLDDLYILAIFYAVQRKIIDSEGRDFTKLRNRK